MKIAVALLFTLLPLAATGCAWYATRRCERWGRCIVAAGGFIGGLGLSLLLAAAGVWAMSLWAWVAR